MKFSVWFSGSCALVYSMQSVAIKHDPSYEFRPDMSVSANVCRVWQETVSEAVSLLGTGSDTGIHETRKRIKKLRALLCFLHPATPGIDDRTEVNDELRRIARTVGAVRDAASMVECAERDLAEWSRLSEVLKSRLAQLKAEEHVPLDNLVARLALLQLRVLVREFSVAKGINLAFERGRECLRDVLKDGTTENFHSLRKATKTLWYLLCMLFMYWPAVLHPLCLEWKVLCDLLGRHHDLALLIEVVEKEHLLEEQQTELISAAKELLRGLEKQIEPKASLLYANKWHKSVGEAVRQKKQKI